ncbi:MAG: hypothetical protein QXY18_02685 [Nitrososphaerota archaeon]
MLEKKVFNKKSIIIIGLLIRILLAPFFGHPWDTYVWIQTGKIFLQNINVYEISFLVNRYPWGFYSYPPIWMYWCSFSQLINEIFFKNLHFQVFLLKIPMIISDTLIALIIYKWISLYSNERNAKKGLLLWYLNPISIFITSIWGMFDSLTTLFSFSSAYYLSKKDYIKASLFLGIGTAIKIFPIFFLPIFLLFAHYQDKLKIGKIIEKIILPFSFIPIIASIPFLSNFYFYIKALSIHFSQIGQFTYWALLGRIINPSYFSIFAPIITIIIVIYAFRKNSKEEIEFNKNINMLYIITLLTFFITSPKVNVQYMLWILPHLIWIYYIERKREYKHLLIGINIISIVFLIFTIFVNNFYNLDFIGIVYEPETTYLQLIGAGGAISIILIDYIMAGTLMKILGHIYVFLNRIDKHVFISILIIFIIFFYFLPTSSGLTLPKFNIRIAIVEGLDSIFKYDKEDLNIGELIGTYDITHVVLPFSPDFINTYNEYYSNSSLEDFLRFKVNSYNWTYSKLKDIINLLHKNNIKVLLGIYLKAKVKSVYLGLYGFEATWITLRHPEILGENYYLIFDKNLEKDEEYGIYENETYANYFTKKLLKVLKDFDFDGVYFMDYPYEEEEIISGEIKIKNVITLLNSSYYILKENKKDVFVEDFSNYVFYEDLEEIFEYSDKVVLRISPWVDTVYYFKVNSTIDVCMDYLNTTIIHLPPNLRKKILIGFYLHDFAAGWFAPASVVQMELQSCYNILKEENLEMEGYSLYYISRYMPYRIFFKK